jgi:hypothetical protein
MSTRWQLGVMSKQAKVAIFTENGNYDGDRIFQRLGIESFSKNQTISALFSNYAVIINLKLSPEGKYLENSTYINGDAWTAIWIDYIYLYNLDDKKWYKYHFGDLVT